MGAGVGQSHSLGCVAFALMQRLVLPPGFEPRFAASETAALSIELREQSMVEAFKSARVRQRSKTLSLWQRRFIVDF